MTYLPVVDELIPVHLPHERIRAQVVDVLSTDAIVVNLFSRPQGKGHDYKEGDWVRCERRPGPIAGEAWEAVERVVKPPKPEPPPPGKRRERK